MDGVRRTTAPGVRPQALVLVPRKPRPAPLSQNATFGRVGIDGVRRQVPSPREMIQNSAEVQVQIPEVLLPRAINRPAIAFSIIASAMIVAGVTGARLIPAHAAAVATSQTQPSAAIATTSPTTRLSAPAALSPTPADAAATAASAQAAKNSSLQAILDSYVAANGSQYSIFVKDLKNGTTASVNADRTMLSASLYKLFVAQRIYQMVDAGTLTYGQTAGNESGSAIDRCLQIMINISDNACGRDLGSILGWSKQDSALKNAGYTNTTLGNGDNPQLTNSKDVGLLLEHLYNGTLMSPNATNRFIELLKDQRVNDRLPKGLPSGTVIAHKTGDLSGYTHDAGIIYGEKTDFEVIVMSGPWASPENSKPAFGDLAGKLNSFFND